MNGPHRDSEFCSNMNAAQRFLASVALRAVEHWLPQGSTEALGETSGLVTMSLRP